MKNWTEKVSGEVYRRLCECRSKKEDLPELVNARWAWIKEQREDQQGYTKADALADVLDHLDSNGQWRLISDLTREEYDVLKREA